MYSDSHFAILDHVLGQPNERSHYLVGRIRTVVKVHVDMVDASFCEVSPIVADCISVASMQIRGIHLQLIVEPDHQSHVLFPKDSRDALEGVVGEADLLG